jgi:hypothetical protein
VEVGAGVEGTEPMMMGIQTEGGREEMNDADADVDDGVVIVAVVAAAFSADDGATDGVAIAVVDGFVIVLPFAPTCTCEVEAIDPGNGINADFIANGVFVSGGGNGPAPAFTLLFSGGSDNDAPPPFLLFPAVTLIPLTCCAELLEFAWSWAFLASCSSKDGMNFSSMDQKKPLPRSPAQRSIFLNARFEDKLCRTEFYSTTSFNIHLYA